MENKEFHLDIGGRNLSLKFVNWAERATGSVIAQYGDTVVLTTVVMGDSDKDMDYFPLTVEYREKYYASGKIGGGRFSKREGRPSDDATLKARLIDRAMRPLFDQNMRREVQVVNTVLSYDEQNTPDVLALIASSASVFTSGTPWDGPIGAVRVSRVDGSLVLNASAEMQEKSTLNVTVAGVEDKINMIEVDAKEVSEKEVMEAMNFGAQYIKKTIDFQKEIQKEIGLPKKEVETKTLDEDFKKEAKALAEKPIKEAIDKTSKEKTEGDEAINNAINSVVNELEAKYGEEKPEQIKHVENYLDKLADELVHEAALKRNKRVDGREFDEVRSLSGEVGILPRTHGSGVFMRGQTHSLCTTTLDIPGEEELADEMEGESKKPFMLHYNFPPYSTGEAGPFRGPGRREIGHGALAEKAVMPLIPPQEDFPYVVRVVSEILSSNGSSSMASVCGASLSLMDAGVPVKKHVAGIAMGLMLDKDNAKVLSDIQGPEDHFGDMDCKVAGTKDGITAMQMDVKVDGITLDLLEKTLSQAKKGREEILAALEKTIEKPRKGLSPYAPSVEFVKIDVDKIGFLIGAGGKTIKEIMAETDTEINIEDNGFVYISGRNKEGVDKATKLVKNTTREIKPGEFFESKVVKIADFGAFVELVPGQEALVHVSELKDDYVKNVNDVVKIGDRLKVKIIEVDEQGRVKASAKQVE